MKWKAPRGHRGPRPSSTYRAAWRNAERGTPLGVFLKADRITRGETRSQADRRRRKEAEARKAAEVRP